MKDLKQLEEQYKLLGEEIEKLKSKEKEPWPKVGDVYYWTSVIGIAHEDVFREGKYDIARLLTNNCHRTEEQALRHKEYITSPRVRARELVEMLPNFSANGRYAILYDVDHGVKTIELVASLYGGLSFSSRQAAMLVIAEHESLIKVALGVIVGEKAERIVREHVGRGE